VEAEPSPSTGVLVTAFRDPEATRLVTVAVNSSGNSIDQPFFVSGGRVGPAVPWVTSEEHALAEQAPIPVSDGSFSALLAPYSVTTFVSELSELRAESEPEPQPEGEQPIGRSAPELSDDTGCSCRAAGHDGPDSGALLALLALAAARARHRAARWGGRA
jgi:MYXO-CTERM domain-containing protein